MALEGDVMIFRANVGLLKNFKRVCNKTKIMSFNMSSDIKAMNFKNNQSDRYVELQVFRFKGDGDLMELAKLEPINTILIPKEIYQEGFVVIKNKGDSMEKLIMDGANVVVDTTKCEIVSGSIYALSIPWEGCILRECHSEPNGVLLRPYNNNYPVSTIGWDEFNPNMVLGTVFCSVMNVFR